MLHPDSLQLGTLEGIAAQTSICAVMPGLKIY